MKEPGSHESATTKTKSTALEVLELRPYRAGDEFEINAAFNRIFRKNRTLVEWRWKFARDCVIGVAVDATGEVHAHMAVIHERFAYEDRILSMGQCLDIFASKSRSVIYGQYFSRCSLECTLRAQLKGDVVIYGFPGSRSGRLGTLKKRHEHSVPFHVWTAPDATPPAGASGMDVTRALPTAAQADTLWKQMPPPTTARAVRDAEWLKHRYPHFKPPFHAVTLVEGFFRRKAAAWAVFLEQPDRVIWLDLLWDRTSDKQLDLIAQEAGKMFNKPLECWVCNDPALEAWLRDRNWTGAQHSEGLHSTFRRPQGSPLTGDANFSMSFMAADTDLFPC